MIGIPEAGKPSPINYGCPFRLRRVVGFILASDFASARICRYQPDQARRYERLYLGTRTFRHSQIVRIDTRRKCWE